MRKAAFLFLFLVCGVVAARYPSPPPRNEYLVDQAGIISDKDEVNDLCRQVERATTAEMAVLTIPSTKGEEIWLYATNVGNYWGVGQKGADNGLLVVVAAEDCQVFTATGEGMEEALPDSVVARIYRQILVPEFKQANYAEGIYKALQAYAVYIERYYDSGGKEVWAKAARTSRDTRKPPDWRGILLWSGIGGLSLLLLAAIFIILQRNRRR